MTRHPVTDTIERHPVVSDSPKIPTKYTGDRRAKQGSDKSGWTPEKRAKCNGNLKPPWKPGESGNPKGKPRQPHITTILKRLLLDKDPKTGKEHQVLLAEAIRAGAERLHNTALKQTLDRVDGPVEQKVEVTTPQPIKIVLQDIGSQGQRKEVG